MGTPALSPSFTGARFPGGSITGSNYVNPYMPSSGNGVVNSMPNGGTMVGAGEIPGVNNGGSSATALDPAGAWAGIMDMGGDSPAYLKLSNPDMMASKGQAIQNRQSAMPGVGAGTAVPGSVSTTGANQNAILPSNGTGLYGMPGIGTNGGIPAVGGSSTLNAATLKDLQKIYGKGIGGQLAQFLASGAGFNQQAINAILAQAEPARARGEAKILDAFGDTGTRFSSAAGLGLADFESQVNTSINAQIAGLYEDSMNRYMSILTNVKGDAAQQKQASAAMFQQIAELAANIAFSF